MLLQLKVLPPLAAALWLQGVQSVVFSTGGEQERPIRPQEERGDQEQPIRPQEERGDQDRRIRPHFDAYLQHHE